MEFTIEVTQKNLSPKASGRDDEEEFVNAVIKALTLKSIPEFVDILTPPKSYLWTGAELEGGNGISNWKSQQVFALDFDCGIDPELIIARSCANDLKPNIWYTPFSDTSENTKYRMIYIFDHPLYSRLQARHLLKYLLYLFPEAEETSKNLDRYFFGGKDAFIVFEDLNSLTGTIEKADLAIITKDHGKTRRLKRLLEDRDNPIQLELTQLQKRDEQAIEKFKSLHQLENPHWNDIASKIKIFSDFISGKELHHNQLLGLATSLHWYKGGVKFMTEFMKRLNFEGKTTYNEVKLKIPAYVSMRGYFPQFLESYSPYPADHQYKEIVSAFTKPRRGVIITQGLEPIFKLRHVENEMDQFFNEFMNSNEPGISILKVPTGIGKTQRLIDLEGVVIATPTNALKTEISRRMKTETFVTPDLPEFTSRKLRHQLNKLYQRGCNSHASDLISGVAEGLVPRTSKKDIKAAKVYLNEMAKLRQLSKEKNLITTHERLIHSNFPQERIIFDEDPEKQLFDIRMFTSNDLDNLTNDTYLSKAKDKILLVEIKSLLANSAPGIVHETPDRFKKYVLEKENQNLLDVDVKNDVNGFMESSFYLKDARNHAYIHYIILNPLPANKPIMIMSASISTFIYQNYYKDRIKNITEFNKVESKGKIIQDTKHSFSRQSLDTKIDDAVRNIEGMKILTFKEFGSELGMKASEMYFGNCTGYDSLKGQNLAVLGTPHMNPIKYFLIAAALGFDINGMDKKMEFQEIKRNGHLFKFNTYNDESLRAIQLDLIEAELIQAAGRARTLREDCTVRLYSNLPLQITTDFVYNLPIN